MKQVAGQLRLELAQYRELAAFAQFGSDLDPTTQAQLARGERLVEILKQGQYAPLSVSQQIVSLFIGVRGLVDDIEVKDIIKFQDGLLNFVEDKHKDILDTIEQSKKIDDDTEKKLKDAVLEYKGLFSA